MEKKEKRERERKIVKDSPKKDRYFGFLQNSFLAILMLISRKLVQRRGTSEKYGFSLLAGRHQRVQLKLRDANDKFD